MLNTYNTVPNQKVVRVHRDMPQKGSNNFLAVKLDNLYSAYKDLRSRKRGGNAIILWIILAGNKDGYSFGMSPQAIESETGLPRTTCQSSILDLISAGYLVPRAEDSNIYDFYETPHLQKDQQTPAVATDNSVVSFNIKDF